MFAGSILVVPALAVFGWASHLIGASPPSPARPPAAATAAAPGATAASAATAPTAGSTTGAAVTPRRHATSAGSPWVAAWTAPPVRPGPDASAIPFDAGTGGRTVRDVIHTTLGGRTVRVRLSNVFGNRTATFSDVRIAVAPEPGVLETVPGTSRRVRFGGATTVHVPAGRIVASDAVRLAFRPGANLAVSIYAPHATGIATTTSDVNDTNYVSGPGDVTTSNLPISFPEEVPTWYWLDGVDVTPRNPRSGAIVALGDSITAGFASSPDRDADWPDRLADRLRAAHTRPPLAVLNAGISGNNLSRASPCFGHSGLERMQRDALDQPGVRDVIVALGVNDITQPRESRSAGAYECLPHRPISAAGMIADYRVAIRRIHAHRLQAIGATITPFGRYAYWTPAIEAERQQINHWIRTSHAFDGVLDFDRVLRDPAHPAWLKPSLDSGDGLHPNDRGHAAMVNAIPLSLFAGS